jgi:hypothetical protein
VARLVIGVARVAEGEAASLVRDRVDDFWYPVADIDDANAPNGVEILISLNVIYVDSGASHKSLGTL